MVKNHITEKLERQIEDIAQIMRRLDRNIHNADVIKEINNLNEYASRLNERLEKLYHQNREDIECPFVVINSAVEVFDPQSNETADYHIVNSKVFELEGNDVTFSSPIGKALLFKQVGDKVEFTIPVGKITYIIKSIAYDENMSVSFEL